MGGKNLVVTLLLGHGKITECEVFWPSDELHFSLILLNLFLPLLSTTSAMPVTTLQPLISLTTVM